MNQLPDVQSFSDNPLQPVDVSVIQQLTTAEIDMAVTTAKRFPRNIKQFKERAIALATSDVDIAMSCNYAVPRGGKSIEGPSVRVAEIVAREFGNVRAYSRVVAIEQTSVVAEGVCQDMETNFTAKSEVRRKITGKDGRRYNEDMINMAANAACSIAFRNAIFKVVPMAYVNLVASEAKKVALGDKNTFGSRKEKMVNKFSELGVTTEMILAKVDKLSMDQLDVGDMEILIKVFAAIDGGDSSVDSEFPVSVQTGATETKEPAKGGKGTGKGKQAPEQAPPAPKQTPKQIYNTIALVATTKLGKEVVDTVINEVADQAGAMNDWGDDDYQVVIDILNEKLAS